jgi:3-dehydroquinate dehydratase-1
VSTTSTVRLHSTVLGEGRTKIIVPLMPRASADVAPALAALAGQPVDIIEWRVDHVSDPELAVGVGVALRTSTALPILLTYRTDREGGLGTLDDAGYAELVARLLRLELADAVDVEYARSATAVASLLDAARAAGVPAVASFHDFASTPGREALLGHLRAQDELGADVLKIAVTPRNAADVAELLAASAAAAAAFGKPLIAISMGRLGLVSRVAGAVFGSCATFATVGEASAPGQLPAAQLAPLLEVFGRE